jgi:hypothetical protein
MSGDNVYNAADEEEHGTQRVGPPQLGVFVDAKQKRLNSVRMLRDNEFAEYREATGSIAGFVSDCQKFQEVRKSYAEYRELIDYYNRKYSVRPRLNTVITGEMNNAINRRLRAFFTEFYFFLEYAERKLKRRYGKDSEQANDFKKATGEQFDGSFAYRFIYQLRGYAQHITCR